MMVGVKVQSVSSSSKRRLPRASVLEMVGVQTSGKGKNVSLADINLSVRSGEILGVAGVEGSGQTELLSAIFNPAKLSGGVRA